VCEVAIYAYVQEAKLSVAISFHELTTIEIANRSIHHSLPHIPYLAEVKTIKIGVLLCEKARTYVIVLRHLSLSTPVSLCVVSDEGSRAATNSSGLPCCHPGFDRRVHPEVGLAPGRRLH